MTDAALAEQIAARYGALEPREARTAFAHELQGFLASEERRGVPLSRAVTAVLELLDLVMKANR